MSIVSEFRKFSLRGNVVDLAVGFTVGAAFTTVAKSLVNDLIMPPIGLALGQADFTNLFIVLRSGVENAGPYATLTGAQAAGAVTVNYGAFLNNLVAFLTIALAMFAIVRSINHLNDAMEEEFSPGEAEMAAPKGPSEKKCTFCLSTIPFKATRCRACTSELAPPDGT